VSFEEFGIVWVYHITSLQRAIGGDTSVNSLSSDTYTFGGIGAIPLIEEFFIGQIDIAHEKFKKFLVKTSLFQDAEIPDFFADSFVENTKDMERALSIIKFVLSAWQSISGRRNIPQI
jgi:hypothetical protein